MQAAMVSVVRELYHFVVVEWFGFRTGSHPRVLEGASMLNAAPAITIDTDATVVYVALPIVQVCAQPTRTFDTVVGTVRYGTAVYLGSHSDSGQWVEIMTSSLRGWVLRDAVTAARHRLQPTFELGKHYPSADPETRKLRLLLHDSFSASELTLPLTAEEYVTYQLLQKNRHIAWGRERPRTAGSWHELLKGKDGVHIGVTPVAEAVMEYVTDAGTGHVAFVEAVFPGDTVLVTEVDGINEGLYQERTLPRDEWRECRPVFITIAR